MKTELAKAGICLNVDKDTVSFDGHISPHPNDLMLDSHNDHRIAMALAALSLKHRSVSISRPGCVAKSYPGFWNDLSAAGFVVVFVQE
jgi:3-phosphoshikimate 1-carboxyvinyltransferase